MYNQMGPNKCNKNMLELSNLLTGEITSVKLLPRSFRKTKSILSDLMAKLIIAKTFLMYVRLLFDGQFQDELEDFKHSMPPSAIIILRYQECWNFTLEHLISLEKALQT